MRWRPAWPSARKLKKLPLLTGNAFGFVGNRLYAAYRKQCEFMVEEGAWPEQVDGRWSGSGSRWDRSRWPTCPAWTSPGACGRRRPPRAIPPHATCRSPIGFAKPVASAARPEPATTATARLASRRSIRQVHALIEQARADKGIATRRIDDEEICRRVVLALVNEAALLLAEGVAERATDVDVALVNGFGFPRWEGGPVFWARERGDAALSADFEWLAQVSGLGSVRGDVRHLLGD
jgi:3-hydroxyacyl-CoA dehydrogenase